MVILIATNNPSKVKEIIAVLSDKPSAPAEGCQAIPFSQSQPPQSPIRDPQSAFPQVSSHKPQASFTWLSLTGLVTPIPEPVEDGATFADNAALKARYYSKAAGIWALADDSGLEVDALGGEPGVHSAYYAREFADQPRAVRDSANNAKLIAALAGVPTERRTARFRCCLALADGERIVATAGGKVEGVIIDEPRGGGGFGYDPHFFISALGKTTAELAPDEKNRISHRGQALKAMKERIVFLFSKGEAT